MASSPKKKTSKSSSGSHKSKKEPVIHKTNKYIKLVEDHFGYYVDDAGKQHDIKRFTWFNHNCIQLQVITYGARVLSLKMPSRKKIVEDVVLGFDDIAGYVYYQGLPLGATIGRFADKIYRGGFSIDRKQYWLSKNLDKTHHLNGGFRGLDKVVWFPTVKDTKVILTYMSPHLEEGYPGDLLVTVTYELSNKNEMIVDIEATCTKSTVVNLSHLMYFNLGGHGAGPEEIHKHIVSLNANCMITKHENGFPTGEVHNVLYTEVDFQTPQLMKHHLGVKPNDGFDHHLCVNRGVDQDLCFVGRALHPPTGRVLEMYSNQSCLHFASANDWGSGILPPPVKGKKKILREDGTEEEISIASSASSFLRMIDKVHAMTEETLTIDSDNNYEELRNLIEKMYNHKYCEAEIPEGCVNPESPPKEAEEGKAKMELNPMQVEYLQKLAEFTADRQSETDYSDWLKIMMDLMATITTKKEEAKPKQETKKTEFEIHNEQQQKALEEALTQEDEEMARKGLVRLDNVIPDIYKDGRYHGKNQAIYKRHCALCFQSQNYPNAINHDNFPCCVLRPGEKYKHTIVYKLWVQSGDPNRWLKRNFKSKKE